MSALKEMPANYIDKNVDGTEETYYPLSTMENLKITLSVLGGQVVLGLLVYITII